MTSACPCCGQPLTKAFNSMDALMLGQLAPIELTILRVLASYPGAWATTARLLEAIYGHRSDGGPISARQSLIVRICHLRKKMKPFGLDIESKRNHRRLVTVQP